MREPTLPPSRVGRDKVPPGCPLTPREFEILGMLADGKTQKIIALELDRNLTTIRSVTWKMYCRLGATNSAEAVVLALRAGWLGYVPEAPEPKWAPPPFLKAYLTAFDEHLRSGSYRSRRAMDLAWTGHRTLVAA